LGVVTDPFRDDGKRTSLREQRKELECQELPRKAHGKKRRKEEKERGNLPFTVKRRALRRKTTGAVTKTLKRKARNCPIKKKIVYTRGEPNVTRQDDPRHHDWGGLPQLRSYAECRLAEKDEGGKTHPLNKKRKRIGPPCAEKNKKVDDMTAISLPGVFQIIGHNGEAHEADASRSGQ